MSLFFYTAMNPIAAIIQASFPCCLINVCVRLCVSACPMKCPFLFCFIGVANVLGSAGTVMTQELVDHRHFAFTLYLYSAQLLHIISPGYQIMCGLA